MAVKNVSQYKYTAQSFMQGTDKAGEKDTIPYIRGIVPRNVTQGTIIIFG